MEATGQTGRQLFLCRASITIVVLVLTGPAWGHFSILVPEEPAVRAGQGAALLFCEGHPYECQWADTPKPERAEVLLPNGQRAPLAIEPRPAKDLDGKPITVHRLSFAPTERGDHLVLVTTPMHFDRHAGGFLQDDVKVDVRVQVQKGWDRAAGMTVELVPLTRPYGWRAGSVFVARAMFKGKPLADAEVEIEQFHPTPPKDIPEDDALITKVVKTDVNGYVICTLDEPGWWAIAVTAEDGTKTHEGKEYPVVRRGILWVKVEERSEKGE